MFYVQRIATLITCLACLSCSSWRQEATTPRVVMFATPHAASEAYAHVFKTAANIGAVVTATTGSRWVQLLQHQAVLLSVELAPDPMGTQLTVSASLLPGKIVFGEVNEAREFRDAYQRLERNTR